MISELRKQKLITYMHFDLDDRTIETYHHFRAKKQWPDLFFNRKSALRILASFQDDDNLHQWKTKSSTGETSSGPLSSRTGRIVMSKTIE